jgi:hypothetical protein
MILTFETMIPQGESPPDLISFFLEHLPLYEAAASEDTIPRLFRRQQHSQGEWVEYIKENVRDVSKEKAERIGLTEVNGELVWGTSRGIYSLEGEHVDVRFMDIFWRRWEYHGHWNGFGRQKFLPPELIPNPREAGRINILSARGTYGRFEVSDGYDNPLAAYSAIAEAWVRPFETLTNCDRDGTIQAAKAWRALGSIPLDQVLTLASLNIGLRKNLAEERRRLRQNRDRQRV